MLKNNLYYILQNEQKVYTIRFDVSHPIFIGHFPERPIVPGACLVRMAEELAAEAYGHSIRFTSICNLRFNQPVTPNQEMNVAIKQTDEKTYSIQLLVCNSLCAQFTAIE